MVMPSGHQWVGVLLAFHQWEVVHLEVVEGDPLTPGATWMWTGTGGRGGAGTPPGTRTRVVAVAHSH